MFRFVSVAVGLLVLSLSSLGGMASVRRWGIREMLKSSDVIVEVQVVSGPVKKGCFYQESAVWNAVSERTDSQLREIEQDQHDIDGYLSALWSLLGTMTNNAYGREAVVAEIGRHRREWIFRCAVQHVIKGNSLPTDLSVAYFLSPHEGEAKPIEKGREYILFLRLVDGQYRMLSPSLGARPKSERYEHIWDNVGRSARDRDLSHSEFVRRLRDGSAEDVNEANRGHPSSRLGQ